jgi:glycerol-3-phosphate dehydrogenase (NAD(P)+)
MARADACAEGVRLNVIGAGAWGTALAHLIGSAGTEVTLWAREPEVVDAVNRQHLNPLFLPEVALSSHIQATSDLAAAAKADAVLIAVPTQHLRAVAAAMPPVNVAINCAKGIEIATGKLPNEILAENLKVAPDRLGALSGPTFAAEVARGLPTAVTLAIGDQRLGQRLVEALGRPTFRPYLGSDPVGAEVGGAVKNVLAIACGIVMGRKLGDNARAALITRGLAEMLRLGRAKGARPETLMGLSGLGDLVLTCAGPQSRNLSLGMALGRGERLADILAQRRSIAEGMYSAAPLVKLAASLGVDMPIAATVDRIVNQGADIDDCVRALLARPFRGEG